MPPLTLQTLPYDLRIAIASALPSFTDLTSLAATCKALHHPTATHINTIISSIAPSYFAPRWKELLRLLRVKQAAATNNNNTEADNSFTSSIITAAYTAPNPTLTKQDLRQLFRLHRDIYMATTSQLARQIHWLAPSVDLFQQSERNTDRLVDQIYATATFEECFPCLVSSQEMQHWCDDIARFNAVVERMTFLVQQTVGIKEMNMREWEAWGCERVVGYVQRTFWCLQEMVLRRWLEGTLEEDVVVSLELSDKLMKLLKRAAAGA